MTTIKKFAEELGLSPATISLALNGSLISEKTHKKVQDKAEELDYIPNNFGRGLQSKSSRLIGYMCNTPVRSFNAETMAALGLQTAQNKYGMVLGVAGDNFENFDKPFQLFLEKIVDAIILVLDTIFGGKHFSYFMGKITKRKLPVLARTSEIVNADLPFAGINQCHGAYIFAKYLLKIGHRLPLGKLAFSTILKMINEEEIIHDQFIESALILRSTV